MKVKFISSIFFTLINVIAFSQNKDSVFYYKPVFLNQCTGEVIVFEEKEGIALTDWDICYIRNFFYFTNEYSFNGDTINIPKLTIKRCVGPCRDFYYCDSLADGYIEDYYYNGRIRIKGIFKNGQPIDTLFSYYDSGSISKFEVYDSIYGTNFLTYYENAQLKEYRNNQEFKTTKFYETGELKEKTDWKEDFYKTKAYYKNGELLYADVKGKDYVYHKNGVIKESIYKKELYKIDRILHPKDYPYYSDRFFETTWLSFDEKGVLTRKIIFDDSEFYFDYENKDNLTQIETNNIISVKFYKNGKKYKGIEYDYTEKLHFLYEYKGRKKVLISKIEGIRITDLINQIENE